MKYDDSLQKVVGRTVTLRTRTSDGLTIEVIRLDTGTPIFELDRR